jgi:hypothetical protein
MGGQGMVPDGSFRAAGSTTGESTGVGGRGGAGGSPGTTGDANIPFDARTDVKPIFDANGQTDVGNLGGAPCGGIDYPPSGFYGDNILLPSYDSIRVKNGEAVEIEANLPMGAALLIKMYWLDGPGGWSDEPSGDFFAKTTPGPGNAFVQEFQSKASGRVVEHGLRFAGDGHARVEYYECGSSTPNGTKVIDWSVH